MCVALLQSILLECLVNKYSSTVSNSYVFIYYRMAAVGHHSFTIDDEYELDERELDQKYMEGIDNYQHYLKAYILRADVINDFDLLTDYQNADTDQKKIMRAALRVNYSNMFGQ